MLGPDGHGKWSHALQVILKTPGCLHVNMPGMKSYPVIWKTIINCNIRIPVKQPGLNRSSRIEVAITTLDPHQQKRLRKLGFTMGNGAPLSLEVVFCSYEQAGGCHQ